MIKNLLKPHVIIIFYVSNNIYYSWISIGSTRKRREKEIILIEKK